MIMVMKIYNVILYVRVFEIRASRKCELFSSFEYVVILGKY